MRYLTHIETYSPGTKVVMADRQIQRAIKKGTVLLDDSYGNGKAAMKYLPTGKWFMISDVWRNNNVFTAMLGAACGDVVGSVYEWHNIKHKLDPVKMVHPDARFTDDTVMTCAVAEGLRLGLLSLSDGQTDSEQAVQTLHSSITDAMQRYGNKYPHAGYGGSFRRWLKDPMPQPYNSWGNGSAMRASFAGWVATSLQEAESLGKITAEVTHNHPEGIKGAQVIAGCIYLLSERKTKEDIRAYAGRYYDLNFTLDEIRDAYTFDVSCAGSVPQAIVAFLEGNDFCDVIAGAISIGGDSDTIAAIAGSLAETIYPIPQELRADVIDRMDKFLLNTIVEAVDFLCRRRNDEYFSVY